MIPLPRGPLPCKGIFSCLYEHKKDAANSADHYDYIIGSGEGVWNKKANSRQRIIPHPPSGFLYLVTIGEGCRLVGALGRAGILCGVHATTTLYHGEKAVS